MCPIPVGLRRKVQRETNVELVIEAQITIDLLDAVNVGGNDCVESRQLCWVEQPFDPCTAELLELAMTFAGDRPFASKVAFAGSKRESASITWATLSIARAPDRSMSAPKA
jgi:hypothetical protein